VTRQRGLTAPTWENGPEGPRQTGSSHMSSQLSAIWGSHPSNQEGES
jgi:hypothetical protein